MKTILIPTEDHDAMPAVLEAARLVAREFDGYMEGFAVRPSPATYVTVEPVSSLAISGAYEGDAVRQVRGEFEAFMQAHGVPPGVSEPAVYSYGWPREELADDAFIGSYGRVFDLIVLGRPGPEPQNPRMPPLEAALFESGRPVLVVPPSVPQSHRTQRARFMEPQHRTGAHQRLRAAAAAPCRQGDGVHCGRRHHDRTVGRGGRASPAPERHQSNGVDGQAWEATGEITLDHAASLGCDLLVKSAFTQSRLRQMIFGGATRHILANATLPVFMAH